MQREFQIKLNGCGFYIDSIINPAAEMYSPNIVEGQKVIFNINDYLVSFSVIKDSETVNSKTYKKDDFLYKIKLEFCNGQTPKLIWQDHEIEIEKTYNNGRNFIENLIKNGNEHEDLTGLLGISSTEFDHQSE